jgi:hypothetical protein
MTYLTYSNEKSIYVLDTSPKTWVEAKNLSTYMGIINSGDTTGNSQGKLAIINSEAEHSYVSDWLLQKYADGGSWPTALDGGGIPYIWLGGSDLKTEGVWEWVDGSTLPYWASSNQEGFSTWGTGALWYDPDWALPGQVSEPDGETYQNALAMGLTTWPAGRSKGEGLGDAGQWNDINEDNSLPYLTEVSTSSTSAPPRLGLPDGSTIAFDFDGNAGKVVKLLGAVFGAEAASNKDFVAIGLKFLDGGTSYEDLAELAVAAAGASSVEATCTLLWRNVIGSTPTASDISPFVDLINSGMTLGTLVTLAAETSLNTDKINFTGLSKTGVEYSWDFYA